MKEYTIFTNTTLMNNFKVSAESEEEAISKIKKMTSNKQLFGYDLLNNSIKLIEYKSYLNVGNGNLKKGKIQPKIEDLIFENEK